ncbi:MAG TPA: response regulator [Clostridiaceae bacterium]|nr:response regulator [Clostridiaceae bacterium]
MKQNSGKRVLIVDDSEMVRNFHSYIIRMFGYQTETAENGAIALEKLLAEEYQLLITDINMPKMDGYELIRNVRENGISIPVIVVSTEEEYRSRFSGVEAGPSLHMVKPTDPEKLITTIKMLL